MTAIRPLIITGLIINEQIYKTIIKLILNYNRHFGSIYKSVYIKILLFKFLEFYIITVYTLYIYHPVLLQSQIQTAPQ